MYEKFLPPYMQRTSRSIGGGKVCEFMERNYRLVYVYTYTRISECFTSEYIIYTTCRWDRRLKSYKTYIILLLCWYTTILHKVTYALPEKLSLYQLTEGDTFKARRYFYRQNKK